MPSTEPLVCEVDPAVRRPPTGPVEAVTCDLWYTLVYLRSDDRRALERRRSEARTEMLREQGVPPAEARRYVRELERWIVQRSREGHAPSLGSQATWLAERSAGWPSVATATRRMDALLASAPIHPAPGVRPALDRLAEHGLRLGLVSDIVNETSEGTLALLDRLDLRTPFRSHVFSADLPHSKPHAEPFLTCLRELGCTAERAVHIGDLDVDVFGAQQAGMRALYYTGLSRWKPRIPKAARAAGLDQVPRLRSWGALEPSSLGAPPAPGPDG
jgi:HAD superfamily hydrolase (TIGR01509 family)